MLGVTCTTSRPRRLAGCKTLQWGHHYWAMLFIFLVHKAKQDRLVTIETKLWVGWPRNWFNSCLGARDTSLLIRAGSSAHQTLKTIGCDLVSALNHISNMVAQLKDVQHNLWDTLYNIYELACRKAESLWIDLKQQSVPKQTHLDNVRVQSV